MELKARLVATPILRRPIRGRPFQLHINWIMLGLGAVLTQCDDEGKTFVVAHASRLKGGRWWLPQVQAVVSLVNSNCSWFILAPKVLQLCINHFVLVLCKSM